MSNFQEREEQLRQLAQLKMNKKAKPQSQFHEEIPRDDDDFIDDSLEDKKYKKKYTHVEHSDDEEEVKQRTIDEFVLRKPKVKQAGGIQLLEEISIEDLARDPEADKVKITNPIETEDDFVREQYRNVPISKPQAAQEIAMEELEELMLEIKQKEEAQLKNPEPPKQKLNVQQTIQQPSKKPVPQHRAELAMPEVKLPKQYSQPEQTKLAESSDFNYLIHHDKERDMKFIPFYWLDIYEDANNNPGEVFLFGKVYHTQKKEYFSSTLYIPNYYRTVFLYYDGDHDQKTLEAECERFMKNQLNLEPSQYFIEIVERRYAFEIKNVETERRPYLKVSYCQRRDIVGQRRLRPLVSSGGFFKFALQSTQSTIEQFLLFNEMNKGPCWIELTQCQQLLKTNKTYFRLTTLYNLSIDTVELKYAFRVGEKQPPPPKLKLVSLAIKTAIVKKEEEIVAISVGYQPSVDIEGKEFKHDCRFRRFLKMPSNSTYPSDYIRKNEQISEFDNEIEFYSAFTQYIESLDPDAVVGHDLHQKQMPTIARGLFQCKTRTWNCTSRLQRAGAIPKKDNLAAQLLLVGRLCVDTYAMATEVQKSSDYSLKWLVENLCDDEMLREIKPEIVPNLLKSNNNIQFLFEWLDKEAQLTIKLMNKLQILPLTLMLTQLAGNIWNDSLENRRAHRIDYLLMHVFLEQDYILPDKWEQRYDNQSQMQLDAMQEENGNTSKQTLSKSNKKNKKQDDEEESSLSYQGGLVLEPMADLYNDYVLIIDFNSLYPSIIMEKSVCFTTVERDKFLLTDDKRVTTRVGRVNEENKKDAILPKIIKSLVNQRNLAKINMKKAQGFERLMWEIKQLAIKLVANSIYGCIGFSNSRFYAVGIASFITQQGREILKDSKARVEKMQHSVIYGDTDSLMIKPRLEGEYNLWNFLKKAAEIVGEINKNYRELRIAIDGVFKTLLLLKKKKYAGMKVKNLDQLLDIIRVNRVPVDLKPEIKMEVKGIDLVRREYCKFAKIVQEKCLTIILNSESRDQMFENIKTLMEEVVSVIKQIQSEEMQSQIEKYKYLNQSVNFGDFIITKQLCKAPHLYSDAENHPHVLVAKRKIDKGLETPDSLVNKMIYYVVCERANESRLSLKAYSPEEYQDKTLSLSIDYRYYLQSQIYDPIQRLCKDIQGDILHQIGRILGVKVKQQNQDSGEATTFEVRKSKQSRFMAEVKFRCPVCKQEFAFSQLYEETKIRVEQKQPKPRQSDSDNLSLKCPNSGCSLESQRFGNMLLLKIKEIVFNYHRMLVKCSAKRNGLPLKCYSVHKKCFANCCLENQTGGEQQENLKRVKQAYSEEEANIQVKELRKALKKMKLPDTLPKQRYDEVELDKLFGMITL